MALFGASWRRARACLGLAPTESKAAELSMSSADRRIAAAHAGTPAKTPAQRLATLVGTFSIEMTAKDGAALHEAKDLIPQGTSISITFLAGETAPARVAAAKQVRSYGFLPRPHISARRIPSEGELKSFLADLAGQ